MDTKQNVDILQTIYDDVTEVAPGIYAVKLNGKYGLIDNNHNITLDLQYNTGIYREYYCVLGTTQYATAKETAKTIVYVYKTGEKFPATHVDTGIDEHSGVGFKVLVVKDAETDTLKVINTVTGDVLYTGSLKTTIQYRPYCFVKFGIKDDSNNIIGITEQFEVDTIENILNKQYKAVDKIKTRYKVTRDDGTTLRLSEYGQEY